MLDLSKIEAGKMDLYLETFEVERIIQDVVTTAQPLIDRNHNRLVIDCPKNFGGMHADVTKLRQILLNLLSNASKFTADGELGLQVERDSSGPQEMILFRVRDSGIGMTPEQIGRLFQAFSPADQSTLGKIRRHRPRARDFPPVRAADGWRYLDREHAGKRIGVHRAAAFALGTGQAHARSG